MTKRNKIFTILLIFTSLSTNAQTSDLGAIASIGVSKKINRKIDLKAEQQIRLNNDFSTFNRSLSSVSLDYSILKKTLNAQLDYDFIYYNKTDFFEFRHRASFALEGSKDLNNFNLSLKTRLQSIWINETVKNYKVNPRLLWRNKFECNYTIFGSALKPYISTEIFCPLNMQEQMYLGAVRAEIGAKYRFTSKISTSFYIRADQEFQKKNPEQRTFLGVSWNYKL